MSLSVISSTLTLPRSSDTPGANGRYLYTTTGLSLAGSNSLRITGPVDLIVSGNVSTAGNAAISITGSTARLNLYSPGTINLTGNAIRRQTAGGLSPATSGCRLTRCSEHQRRLVPPSGLEPEYAV